MESQRVCDTASPSLQRKASVRVPGSFGPPDSWHIVAVLDRITLGCPGLDAGDRFAASPSALSTFVVLQIVVYAGAQVPAGLLLDRFGSKALILSGATLMAVG